MKPVVNSLENFPKDAGRNSYAYLFDYSRHEPINHSLRCNLDNVRQVSSKNIGMMILIPFKRFCKSKGKNIIEFRGSESRLQINTVGYSITPVHLAHGITLIPGNV